MVSGLGIALEPSHTGTDYTFTGNYSDGQISITGPGEYYLTDNFIVTSFPFGIQLETHDILLDGNGKSLIGTNGIGIHVTFDGNNARIPNFSNISGFSSGIESTGDSVVISGNTFSENERGLVSKGNFVEISDNSICRCYYGIRSWVFEENPAQGGSYAVISNNSLFQNYNGVVSGGNYALISGNTVYENNRGITAGGAYLSGHSDPGTRGFGYYANIVDNLVYGNKEEGIYNLNPNARILRNTVYDNGKYGVYLHRGNTNTTISDNVIGNQSYGLLIMANDYTNVTINRNKVQNNSEFGLFFRYDKSYGQMGGNGTIFDNYLENMVNVGGSGSIHNFTWSHPGGPVSGSNVIGGPYVAGNYWSNPDGNGWSDLQDPKPSGYTTIPYEVYAGSVTYDTAPLVHVGQYINSSSDGWTINSPHGNIIYPRYSDATYITQAKPGAVLGDVLVDGGSVGPNATYMFTEIFEDHSIETVGSPSPGQVHVMFNCTPETGTSPLTVQFTDKSVGVPHSWYWQFGDGGNSTEQNPAHTYNIPGTYTVSLRAYNEQTSGYGVCNGFVKVAF